MVLWRSYQIRHGLSQRFEFVEMARVQNRSMSMSQASSTGTIAQSRNLLGRNPGVPLGSTRQLWGWWREKTNLEIFPGAIPLIRRTGIPIAAG
jgi:hypothetical protein